MWDMHLADVLQYEDDVPEETDIMGIPMMSVSARTQAAPGQCNHSD